jgi:hypothetical protein
MKQAVIDIEECEPEAKRIVTIRRIVQQLVHCANEALSVIEHTEDIKCAVGDLQQARLLVDNAERRISMREIRKKDMAKCESIVTTRRMVQQLVHCANKALSVIEHTEDLNCALDDLQQARSLIDIAYDKIIESL